MRTQRGPRAPVPERGFTAPAGVLAGPSRDAGVDAVRGFAIVAMVVAHTQVFVPETTPHVVDVAMDLLNDVASPLFALIIGVTAAISTRRSASWTTGVRRRFLLSWVLKAVLLIVLGWLLELRPAGVFVVLEYLGATMILATPLLLARQRWVIGALVALVIAGPALNAAARESSVASTSSGLLEELLDWTVLGSAYRVTGLLPLLLLGLLLGRWQLGDHRRTRLVLLAGLVLAPIGHLAVEIERRGGEAFSGSWADLTRDIGLSLVAYGAIMLMVGAGRPRWADVIWHPLEELGSMALTIYVLHVVVLMVIWDTALPFELAQTGSARGWLVMAGLVGGCIAFAVAWRRWLGTGPIERVVGVLSLRHPPRTLLLRTA